MAAVTEVLAEWDAGTTANPSTTLTLADGLGTLGAVFILHTENTAAPDDATALTWDGASATKVTGVDPGFVEDQTEAFWINSPTTGSAVTIAITKGNTNRTALRVRVIGIDASSLQQDAQDSDDSAGTSSTLSLSGVSGGLTFYAHTLRNTHGTVTPGSGETEQYTNSTGDASNFCVTEPGAASQTFGGSWATSRAYGAIAFSLSSAAGAPTAPSDLTVTRDATNPTTRLDLAWTDNSSDETGFRIYMRDKTAGETEWTLFEVRPAGSTSYEVPFLKVGNCYAFRVTAFNGAGESGWTEDSECTAFAAAAPATLTLTGFAPSLIVDRVFTPGVGALTLTGLQPTLLIIPPAAGVWTPITQFETPGWTVVPGPTGDVWTPIVN